MQIWAIKSELRLIGRESCCWLDRWIVYGHSVRCWSISVFSAKVSIIGESVLVDEKKVLVRKTAGQLLNCLLVYKVEAVANGKLTDLSAQQMPTCIYAQTLLANLLSPVDWDWDSRQRCTVSESETDWKMKTNHRKSAKLSEWKVSSKKSEIRTAVEWLCSTEVLLFGPAKVDWQSGRCWLDQGSPMTDCDHCEEKHFSRTVSSGGHKCQAPVQWHVCCARGRSTVDEAQLGTKQAYPPLHATSLSHFEVARERCPDWH